VILGEKKPTQIARSDERRTDLQILRDNRAPAQPAKSKDDIGEKIANEFANALFGGNRK